MVGVVIVSHSAKVAEGAREIALQMAGEGARIAACGGSKEGGIGTDPDAIKAAIESVLGDSGAVVLADLGSAVMSAEMVLELLPAESREKVRIANAPVVEGAVVATVEASIGRSLEEVLAAAEQASFMQKVEKGA